MFARLASGGLEGGERVLAAMRAHPDLVGGPRAADSALMRSLPGAVAKRGTEGVLCAALADGTGVAVKVEDGANRAARPAAGRFLEIPALLETPVFNSRGEDVGRILAAS